MEDHIANNILEKVKEDPKADVSSTKQRKKEKFNKKNLTLISYCVAFDHFDKSEKKLTVLLRIIFVKDSIFPTTLK